MIGVGLVFFVFLFGSGVVCFKVVIFFVLMVIFNYVMVVIDGLIIVIVICGFVGFVEGGFVVFVVEFIVCLCYLGCIGGYFVLL